MSVKPILFSAPMIRALIEGRKTQTRCVLKPLLGNLRESPFVPSGLEDVHRRKVLAKYMPGDLLWVRETWAKTYVHQAMDEWIVFREGDNRTDYGGPWRPSIFMPRYASRLTLEVTDVRVQRLQKITLEDVRAEGVEVRNFWLFGADGKTCDEIARRHFRPLWDSINAKRGFGWIENPWVAAVTFKVHKINVDALLARRIENDARSYA